MKTICLGRTMQVDDNMKTDEVIMILNREMVNNLKRAALEENMSEGCSLHPNEHDAWAKHHRETASAMRTAARFMYSKGEKSER